MISATLARAPYGDDLFVANVARKSFGARYEAWSEVPRGPRQRSDRELVEGLAQDRHWLPFRHPHATLECQAMLPIARQLEKHQVGLTWSETSRRYKTKDLSFHFMRGQWRGAPLDRRQGRGSLLAPPQQVLLDTIQAGNVASCLNDYDRALRAGVAPELARILLPQSMEVSWTWTGSLLAWAYLVLERRHENAQAETAQFADQVDLVLAPHFPVCWAALMETRR